MISYYGYADGSGEYFIVVDTDKCDGCGACVEQCPQGALEIRTELIDLEDRNVAGVTEEHRRKLRYTCASCKPETGQTPCVLSCEVEALGAVWKLTTGRPEDSSNMRTL